MEETLSIMAFFEEDHFRLDQLLAKYLKWKEESPSKARQYFVQFKAGALRHLQWEEEILFPVVDMKTDMDGPIRILRMEHRQIISLLDTLDEKLKKNDRSSEIEEYQLLTLLGEHNLKEEMIVFPTIETIVTQEEVEQIFKAMNYVARAS